MYLNNSLYLYEYYYDIFNNYQDKVWSSWASVDEMCDIVIYFSVTKI
jgi:hypothetical protein